MEKIIIETFPAFLINSGFNYIERINDASKLQVAPLLTIKSKSMVGCFILINKSKLFEIQEIKVVGNFKTKWYDFTFGNSTKLIEIYGVFINSNESITKCIELTKFVKDIDAYSVKHEE